MASLHCAWETSIPDQSAGWCLARMLSDHVSPWALNRPASPESGQCWPLPPTLPLLTPLSLWERTFSVPFLSPLVTHPTFSYWSWNANRSVETVHGYSCVSWWLDSYLMFPSSFCGGQWQITQPHDFLPAPDLLRNYYLLETETGKRLKGQQENRLFR